MIKTTYLPLAKGAQELGMDPDELLLAAAEGRVDIYILMNLVLKVFVMIPYYDDQEGRTHHYPNEEFTKKFDFVRIMQSQAIDLLTGDSVVIRQISREHFTYLDVIEPSDDEVLRFPRERAYVKREDVEIIKDTGVAAVVNQEPSVPTKTKVVHFSAKLKLVLQAAERYWGENVDQNDPSTQEKNEVVAEWLEKQGLSKSQAKQAASIIRPEWAHKGRMPD